MRRQPEGPPPAPVVQRVRIRYAKRGRLRFTSHRDIARALERALRRAELPVAFSAGFSPHPRVSYAGAAPTGVASEAEYFEVALSAPCDVEQVRADLDAALPPGLDVLEVVTVEAADGSLADRLVVSRWQIELAGVPVETARTAVAAFLDLTTAPVERLTKSGTKTVDVRTAVLAMTVAEPPPLGASTDAPDGAPGGVLAGESGDCATLLMVVRHLAPAVRPDDVMTALRVAAGLTPPVAPRVTRLAQGQLAETPPGTAPRLLDPLDHHPAIDGPASLDAVADRTTSYP